MFGRIFLLAVSYPYFISSWLNPSSYQYSSHLLVNQTHRKNNVTSNKHWWPKWNTWNIVMSFGLHCKYFVETSRTLFRTWVLIFTNFANCPILIICTLLAKYKRSVVLRLLTTLYTFVSTLEFKGSDTASFSSATAFIWIWAVILKHSGRLIKCGPKLEYDTIQSSIVGIYRQSLCSILFILDSMKGWVILYQIVAINRWSRIWNYTNLLISLIIFNF